jgi:hypothetical protein
MTVGVPVGVPGGVVAPPPPELPQAVMESSSKNAAPGFKRDEFNFIIMGFSLAVLRGDDPGKCAL